MTPVTSSAPRKSLLSGKARNGLIVFLIFVIITSLLAWGIRWTTQKNTLGADFFIYYWAGRGAFTQGMSPYDPQLVSETQLGISGKITPPDQDQMAFAYPAFALFPVFPLVWFDFPTAQAVWMALNLVLLILSAVVLMPQAPPWMPITLPMFYPIAFALILGNYNTSTGVVLMFFLCLFVLRKTRSIPIQILTGALLAWAVVKPQLTWLFLLLAGLIILRDRLWALLISAVASVSALVASSFIIFPVDWPAQWLARTQAYTHYIHDDSVIYSFLKMVLPNGLAYSLAAAFIGVMLVFTVGIFAKWWVQSSAAPHLPTRVERFFKDHFLLQVGNLQILAWIGFVVYLIHPFPKSYEQIALMVPLFLWAASNWKEHKKSTLLLWLSGLVLSWVAFYASIMNWNPVAIYAIPVFFFAIWILFVFIIGFLPITKRMTHAPA
jgi:hypothetical protein